MSKIPLIWQILNATLSNQVFKNCCINSFIHDTLIEKFHFEKQHLRIVSRWSRLYRLNGKNIVINPGHTRRSCYRNPLNQAPNFRFGRRMYLRIAIRSQYYRFTVYTYTKSIDLNKVMFHTSLVFVFFPICGPIERRDIKKLSPKNLAVKWLIHCQKGGFKLTYSTNATHMPIETPNTLKFAISFCFFAVKL